MLRIATGLVAALLISTASAAAQTAAPDGKALFASKTCVACHGRNGARAIQVFPNIAAQDAKYLLAQMNDIADGKRISGNDDRGYPRTQGMKDIMHLVNAEERAAIADYLAKAEPAKVKPLDPPIDDARRAAGKDAYAKGGCTTCHGADGLKPLASYPIIGGMKRDYLVLQMTEIRDGIRKNGKVATMLPFAKKLDDTKIAAISDYLSQIERPAK
ncbi:c-type cytochrome [Pinisolibacter sp.]|uniref:c-type cytochrome n=1 Tax=Pinisolibacter sp. TaxID=2172024 RepID=UPI002FDD5EE2